jgi:hypothetical protein
MKGVNEEKYRNLTNAMLNLCIEQAEAR